jgi:hypothetical protein
MRVLRRRSRACAHATWKDQPPHLLRTRLAPVTSWLLRHRHRHTRAILLLLWLRPHTARHSRDTSTGAHQPATAISRGRQEQQQDAERCVRACVRAAADAGAHPAHVPRSCAARGLPCAAHAGLVPVSCTCCVLSVPQHTRTTVATSRPRHRRTHALYTPNTRPIPPPGFRLDTDGWVAEYEKCKDLTQDIVTQVQVRHAGWGERACKGAGGESHAVECCCAAWVGRARGRWAGVQLRLQVCTLLGQQHA